jgi:hypothetical protein
MYSDRSSVTMKAMMLYTINIPPVVMIDVMMLGVVMIDVMMSMMLVLMMIVLLMMIVMMTELIMMMIDYGLLLILVKSIIRFNQCHRFLSTAINGYQRLLY